MRSNQRLFVASGLLFVLAVSGPAVLGAENMTVGGFVQDLARLKSLTASDARVAAASLASVGVRLPSDLDFDKSLTEADVTLISGAAGLRVTTTTPEAPFDSQRAERFFVAFGSELGGLEPTAAETDSQQRLESGHAKGKCKGKNKPPRSRPHHCDRP
jgi:hypothetical protein